MELFLLILALGIFIAISMRKKKSTAAGQVTWNANSVKAQSNSSSAIQMSIDSCRRVADETLILIRTSNNVETVLSRWKFFVQEFSESCTRSIGIYSDRFLEAEQLLVSIERDRVSLLQNRDEIFRKAIDRAYLAELEKASVLKTESGRHNRMERFFAITSALEGLETVAKHIRDLQENCSSALSSTAVSSPVPLTIGVTASIKSTHTKQEILDAEAEFARHVRLAFPSKGGLYPHELLMLEYAPHYRIDETDFPGFWFYQYFVIDPKAILDSLMSRGFLQAGGIRTSLENARVPELRDALQFAGLGTSGKKDAMVSRLLTECDHAILSKVFPLQYYTHTETGKTELNENAYVPYIHKHRFSDIDAWVLNQLMQQQDEKTYQQVVWDQLESLRKMDLFNKNYGLYRCRTFELSTLLIEMTEDEKALSFLAEVIFYDLSGLDNNWDFSLFDIKMQYLFSSDMATKLIPPGITQRLIDIMNHLSMSVDDIEHRLKHIYQGIDIPFHRFTQEESVAYTRAVLIGDENKMRSIYAEAKRRFSSVEQISSAS